MFEKRRITALSLVIAMMALTFGTMPAFAQDGRLTCESSFHNYEYCRVNTENKVRLVRRLSSARCDRGSSWGYDKWGIWVDRGCRAEFEYGKSGGKTGAIVAGTVIGGALLAAIIASKHNKDKNEDNENNDYAENRNEPPNWLVGTFRAYQGRNYTDVTVYPDGRVWTAGTGVEANSSGTFYRDHLYINGSEYQVSQVFNGFNAYRLDPGNHATIFYERLR